MPSVVERLQSRSVLDVGCGRGTWLDVFRRRGLAEILGINGPPISAADLEIPSDAFLARDLGQPLSIGQRFDLVISLEVAEHLEAALAPIFVQSPSAPARKPRTRMSCGL